MSFVRLTPALQSNPRLSLDGPGEADLTGPAPSGGR